MVSKPLWLQYSKGEGNRAFVRKEVHWQNLTFLAWREEKWSSAFPSSSSPCIIQNPWHVGTIQNWLTWAYNENKERDAGGRNMFFLYLLPHGKLCPQSQLESTRSTKIVKGIQGSDKAEGYLGEWWWAIHFNECLLSTYYLLRCYALLHIVVRKIEYLISNIQRW